MKTQEKLQSEFLVELVEYYAVDPQLRRCSSSRNHITDICQYSPTDTSEGCAIGRKISKKLASDLDKIGFNSVNGAVSNPEIFDMLPKKLKKLGIEFLSDMQGLHDLRSIWMNKEILQKRIDLITRKYNLPKYTVTYLKPFKP